MDDSAKMEQDVKGGERQASFRRRKHGAFLRPNLIDVVGQPKHRHSETHEHKGVDEQHESFIPNEGDGLPETDETKRTYTKAEHDAVEKTVSDRIVKSQEEYVKELDNLTNLLRSLIIKEFEVSPDQNLNENVERRSCKSKTELSRKLSQSEKEIRFDRVIEWKDDEDHVMVKLPLTPQKAKKCMHESTINKTAISRTRSLPETKRTKSKFSGFLNFGRGRQSNASNNVFISSDGEGSAQSIMSFTSTSSSSSHGRRSRSGSILSRSRTCSSPMSDKRSRAGSLIVNRTGCPQYFIPGENRGRIFMEPLDLFQTKTVCIKGISFRIMKDMPRTHRAMSMIGCMGFIVPAPSKYFEK